jgi:CMP-2-keto-3-deoxyoctulosonic acid synthetase
MIDPRMNKLEIIQAKRIDNKAGSYRVTISRSDIDMSNYSILVNINDHFELINKETITDVIDIIDKDFDNSIKTSEEIINTLWDNLNL